MREVRELLSPRQRTEAVWLERAHRLAQPAVSVNARQNAFPVLVVGIGKERYGIDLGDVAEVLPPLRATPVPGAAAVFAGVINVHGEIRPVLDLRRFLRMEMALETPALATPMVAHVILLRMILLRKDGREMGLQIDSVEHVRLIGAGDLQAAGNETAGWSQNIKGSTKDRLMLLNTDTLFAELQTGVTT
jgi:purine-binding chemotaxis protein CheW